MPISYGRQIIFFALSLISAISLAGCQWRSSSAPPPCGSVQACQAITSQFNKACDRFSNRQLSWFVHNNSPNRKITIAVTQTVEHLNQGIGDTTTSISKSIEAGKDAQLGCEYIHLSTDYFDHYTWKFASGCFADDPNCTEPAQVAQAPHACSAGCQGETCIQIKLNRSNQIEGKASDEINTTIDKVVSSPVLPKEVDLSQLIGVAQACPSRGSLNIVSGRFHESGDTCREYLQMRPDLKMMLTLPAQLAGQLNRIPNSEATLLFDKADEAPQMEWFDRKDTSLGYESLSQLTMSRGLVTLTGDRHYCIRIDAPRG